ncbi:MAG TPA: hypothetical protein PLH19_15060 [Anaerolineae bacterium]|nr:hypothetical protein [Anaerolineae bacterium]HQH39835.1 hypothetical protein [Anaerolineae bacterium]
MVSIDNTSKVIVSPRMGALLTQVTEVPDLETALWKVLSEYIDLKIERLSRSIQEFETKWEMSFSEFAERCAAGTLEQDPYAYHVESDYWEWESAETLLQHYEDLRVQWM